MRVFYLCPEADAPTGGIKQIYRHVEALRAAGVDAWVLQERPQPPAWFASTAPVAWPRRAGRMLGTLARRPTAWMHAATPPTLMCPPPAGGKAQPHVPAADDVLLLPEFLGVHLQAPGWPVRLGVFNQNAHYTFNFSTTAQVRTLGRGIYAHAEFVLCVSEHSREYLCHAFPGLPVLKTLNGVDTDRFAPHPHRRRQIAFMPRKLEWDAVQVFNILNCRGRLDGWDLVAIDGMTEAQVADTLGRSRIFLSTCSAEGFGLPPLEAAAAGCSVVGYTGYAAAEFMRPDLCRPVAQGDVLALARATEALVEQHNALGDTPMAPEAEAHRHFVRQHYGLANERESILAAWRTLAAGSPR